MLNLITLLALPLLPLSLAGAVRRAPNTSPAPTLTLTTRTWYGDSGYWGNNECTDSVKSDKCFNRGWGWGCDSNCECTPPDNEPHCDQYDKYDECSAMGHGYKTNDKCECVPPVDQCEDTKYQECEASGKDCDDKCECQCKAWVIWACKHKGGYLTDDCMCNEPSGDPHHRRRSMTPNQVAVLKRRSTAACPFPDVQEACPLNPLARRIIFECVDTKRSLDQCGGCVTEGKGADCSAIEAVEDVACEEGRCVVRACEKGWRVSEDGASCEKKRRKGVKGVLANAVESVGQVIY